MTSDLPTETSFRDRSLYGDDSMKDTPVPIPNTEVKLHYADGTRRETSRETRKLPNKLKDPKGSFFVHIRILFTVSRGPVARKFNVVNYCINFIKVVTYCKRYLVRNFRGKHHNKMVFTRKLPNKTKTEEVFFLLLEIP